MKFVIEQGEKCPNCGEILYGDTYRFLPHSCPTKKSSEDRV